MTESSEKHEQATTPAPSRSSTISLREVNRDNWQALAKLKPTTTQQELVATNLFSICESHYDLDEIVRGIYADDEPVGLVVMSVEVEDDWYGLFRFMIDQRYQSLGFGRRALDQVVQFIRDTYPAASFIRLWAYSTAGSKPVPASDSPVGFYEKTGWFKLSDDLNEDGEVEMRYTLKEAV